MIIEIEALDTLFFKDGKPFSMGDEVWADGIFPPPPSVLYGALRSTYFGNNPEMLEKANTPEDITQNLEIKKIYYSIKNEVCLPLPLDIAREKKKKKDSFVSLKLTGHGDSFHSKSHLSLLSSEKETEASENSFIGLSEFKNEYINGRRKEFNNIKSLSEHLIKEPKTGIGRNNGTRTSQEGMLYRLGMNRLKDFKLMVEFEGLELPDKGLIKLGAEGKAAIYKIYKSPEESKYKALNLPVENIYRGEKNILVMYLLTPAVFENGWLPSWIDPDTFEVNHPDKEMKIKLLTACTGKFISMGGFDIKANQPKPMRRAVPAGSVYYFEAENRESFEKAVSYFHNKSVSEYGTAKQGFGISFTGGLR